MLNKKIILTSIFVLFGGLILYKIIKGKKMQNSNIVEKRNFTDIDFLNALKVLKSKNFDYNTLSILEKMYRLETNHFKSNQYKRTGTGGQETKNGENIPFPYGWSSLIAFNEKYNIKPLGIAPFVDNQTKKTRYFIIYNSVLDACLFKMFFIEKYRSGRWELWNSLNEQTAANYKKVVLSINPIFTKQLFNKI